MIKKALFIFLLACILYLPSSFFRDLFLPDEARNVSIAANIHFPDNFLVPSYHSHAYYQKPPLYFWMIHPFAKSGLKFLPFIIGLSVLFSFLLIFINYLFVRKRGGEKTAGYASFILSTSVLFYVMSSLVRMDIIFVLFVSASLYLFYLSLEKEKLSLALLSGAAGFLACFTKGGLGFFLPLIVETVFILFPFKKKGLKYLLAAASVSAVLIAGWMLLFSFSDHSYLYHMLFKQTLGRAFFPASHEHPYFFYFPYILAASLPWSLLLLGYLVRKAQDRSFSEWEKFSFVWLAAGFILLSILKSKLVMYLLILSLPLANLSAEYIVKDKRSSGLLLKISLGFLAVSFTGASFYFRGKIPVFSLALFLGLFFCFSFILSLTKAGKNVFWILGISWILVIEAANFVYLPRISYQKGFKQVSDFVKRENISFDKVYVDKKKFLSLSLYFREKPVVFSENPPLTQEKYVFVSSEEKKRPYEFLGRKGKFYIWYKRKIRPYGL